MPAGEAGMQLPLCPVHEGPMIHDFGSWARALPPEEVGPGPLFKCRDAECRLRWAPQHEYFELRDGRPRYTNMNPAQRMRCRMKGHGCLYVAEISREENKWTWRCTQCEQELRAAPGIWVNPPEW
jgi:hypothetical protein